MAYVLMAYIGTACIVMAHILMAYTVMAYIVMADRHDAGVREHEAYGRASAEAARPRAIWHVAYIVMALYG